HILEALINQGAKNFCIATLRDEKALELITSQHKVGDKVSLNLGGYSDKFAGNPVAVTAKVEFIGEYGSDPIAVIGFGDNNHVIITPHLNQVTTPDIFKALDIDFESLDIIVLKSRVHFRRGFYETGIAGEIIEVDAPGWGPADLSTLEYKNIPTNLYPIHRKD
ncbi:MAG: MlrC C-terminal domain-containing protein, partial [Gammaproteobacteria bacterium]|nr:MlrC C-terminal domain-containing protein [Gammaproteobacteria bacterium]